MKPNIVIRGKSKMVINRVIKGGFDECYAFKHFDGWWGHKQLKDAGWEFKFSFIHFLKNIYDKTD